MAGKSTERAEIQELIRISDEARSQLGVKIGKVQRSLEVPTRVVGSLRSSPVAWLVGSMGAGIFASFLLSRIPRRKSKSFSLKKKALGLTLTAVRPLAKVWLTKQVKSLSGKWIAERVKATPSPFQIEPDPPAEQKPHPNPEHVRTSGP